MSFPSPTPFPAAVTPEVFASWQGKSAAAVHLQIKRRTIPEQFVLRLSERVVLIDVGPLLEHLRAKRATELIAKAEARKAALEVHA
jgi:hypothetical protein